MILFMGCLEDPAAEISVDREELIVSGDGGKVAVNVTGDCSSISIAGLSGDSWVEADMSELQYGIAYFEVRPNETYSERSVTVTFENAKGGSGAVMKLIQSQNDAIIPADREFSFSHKTCEFVLETEANVEYEVRIVADWISLKDEPTKALESRQLTFVVSENPSNKGREALIDLKYGRLVERIFVAQDGRTDRVILEMFHNEDHFTPVFWYGGDVTGTVIWGDGASEAYRDGLTHTFADPARGATTRYEMSGVNELRIDSVGSISSIIIEYEPAM